MVVKETNIYDFPESIFCKCLPIIAGSESGLFVGQKGGHVCAKCGLSAFYFTVVSAKIVRWFHKLINSMPVACCSRSEAWPSNISSVLRNVRISGTHSGCSWNNFIVNAIWTPLMLCKFLYLKMIFVDCSRLHGEHLLKWRAGGGGPQPFVSICIQVVRNRK